MLVVLHVMLLHHLEVGTVGRAPMMNEIVRDVVEKITENETDHDGWQDGRRHETVERHSEKNGEIEISQNGRHD